VCRRPPDSGGVRIEAECGKSYRIGDAAAESFARRRCPEHRPRAHPQKASKETEAEAQRCHEIARRCGNEFVQGAERQSMIGKCGVDRLVAECDGCFRVIPDCGQRADAVAQALQIMRDGHERHSGAGIALRVCARTEWN
jgi:hypothetical protein